MSGEMRYAKLNAVFISYIDTGIKRDLPEP